ncbi:MAG: insulinase family protein, partial [Rikenellaceae bacterium]|nr:insulinase family protein [Rikenellaceae bacterium]
MQFETFTLPNGIRCVLGRERSTSVVHCGLTIGVGSRDEEPNEYGIAHFIEHCIFKGTKKRRAYQINNRLDNLGGELNAFTTKEETVIHATTLKTNFPQAIELIADVVFNSVFPAKELDKERDVIFDEIN